MRMLKRVSFDVLKGAIAAVARLAGLILGGIINPVLGLPTTGMPPQAMMSVLIPLMFLTLVLISILLEECFRNLYPRYWQRLLSIWLCNYLMYYLLNTLDAMLFSPLPNMSTSIVANILPALFMTAVIAVLWRPANIAQDSGRILEYFRARKTVKGASRLGTAGGFPPSGWRIYTAALLSNETD